MHAAESNRTKTDWLTMITGHEPHEDKYIYMDMYFIEFMITI